MEFYIELTTKKVLELEDNEAKELLNALKMLYGDPFSYLCKEWKYQIPYRNGWMVMPFNTICPYHPKDYGTIIKAKEKMNG